MLQFFQLRLAPWVPSFRSVWERDRDPFLNELRWRLHLRLLLISAGLSLLFVLRNVATGGSLDIGIGVIASLLAWALLRQKPAYNQWVVRANLSLFCVLGSHALWVHGPEHFPAELLALMIMPVFATLLDGVATGALVLSVALFAAGAWLGHHGQVSSGNTLTVIFCMISSTGLYLCCVAHTWIFTTLVGEGRRSTRATQATRQAVEKMAATLSDQVFSLTKRLTQDLSVKGLQGLEAAGLLNASLKQARAERPAEIPQNAVVPAELLHELRRSALVVFLAIALILAAVALVIMLLVAPPLWQLAAGMTFVSAILLRGSRRDPHWHWRLRLFVYIAIAACTVDAYLSSHDPPAASLVFLPVIVYFSAMLDEAWSALLACVLGLAVTAVAFVFSNPSGSYTALLVTTAFILPTLIAVSAATLPMYRSLLERLSAEEAELGLGLASYRRLMSTFFHDLANPLTVLQTIGSLPAALQTSDDAQRALRMADRIDGVAQAARQALLGAAPTLGTTTLGQLGDELYDLFKERLREKELQWVLGPGADIALRQSGPLLRDSVLGNLLSNAVKFSPAGSSVELRAWRTGGEVHLQLSDTGRGIPAQVLADLAQGRSPQSQTGTQGESGSGFGLLLAKTYMAELGGRLELRPRASGGTEAELILPQS